jgi:uncharacterized membrane protein
MHPANPLWMKAFLAVHIAAGAIAFVMAPMALITAKGGRAHRRWGKIYLWSMGVVAVTALTMSIYLPIVFLALVAVFSFYACFSAWRVLALKDLPKGGRAKPIDWAAAIITFVASACLAGFGAFKPAIVQHMGIVAIVFGIIGMSLAFGQIRSFVWRPTEKMFWWYTHLGNMIASYIAAWTAFSVTTLSNSFRHAGILLWLWPTIIGVPAIALTTAYYKRKFAPRAKAAT